MERDANVDVCADCLALLGAVARVVAAAVVLFCIIIDGKAFSHH